MYRFERRTDDELVLTLFEGEVALLTMLLAELRALLLQADRDNAATERLFPRAYLDPTEEEAETDWQSVVHDDLVREKVIALDAVHAALQRPTPGPDGSLRFVLDRTEEEQFLLSVNDARLAFAALAGGDGEPQARPVAPDDDAGGAEEPIPVAELIEWLGQLVEALIDLKLADLPEEGFSPNR